MKYLFFVVLLVVVGITAGCISGDKNTPVTTPLPTVVTAVSKEPIVGIWEYKLESGEIFGTWTFKPDGTFFLKLADNFSMDGVWRKVSDNRYEAKFNMDRDSDENHYIYIPQSDTVTHDISGITTKLHRIYTTPTPTITRKKTTTTTIQIPQIIYVTVTATPTATVVRSQDPIIGVWRYDGPNGFMIYHFYADSNLVISFYDPDKQSTSVLHGTWSAQGSNFYKILYAYDDNPATYIYDPSRNAIYDQAYPHLLLTPYQGDVEAASKAPVSTPTYSSPSSSSGSTHLYGSGDDVRSFTATGSGLRIFTMSHTGTHNFAVVLKDSGGNYATLLANEIGSYSGKKSERLTSGTYYLDITADGSWTIDISSM